MWLLNAAFRPVQLNLRMNHLTSAFYFWSGSCFYAAALPLRREHWSAPRPRTRSAVGLIIHLVSCYINQNWGMNHTAASTMLDNMLCTWLYSCAYPLCTQLQRRTVCVCASTPASSGTFSLKSLESLASSVSLRGLEQYSVSANGRTHFCSLSRLLRVMQ